MSAMILSVADDADNLKNSETVQVRVNVHAEVISPSAAGHRANVWLTMHAGHLLIAKNPELVLADSLHWRLEVFRSVPQLGHPGSVQQNRIGQIHLDARTGEVLEPLPLIEALKANADALIAG